MKTIFNIAKLNFHPNPNKHTVNGADWGKRMSESSSWHNNVKSIISDNAESAIQTLARDFWDMMGSIAESYNVGPESFSLEISEGKIKDGRFWQVPCLCWRGGQEYNVGKLIAPKKKD